MDLLRAALLDDGDVARRVADDLVDRRREHGRRAAVAAGRDLAAPAEDDQVGLLLARRLDDPLRGVPADPHDRVDGRAVGRVVEDALEQPPGVPGARRALRQRHPLGDLHDAERRQLAGPLVEHRRAEADQLLGGHRVGDRDEDPGRQRGASGHGSLVPALHEVRLEQLELARLALDPLLGLVGGHVAVLDDEAADPPEVDRDERRDERLQRRLRVAGGDHQVVDDAGPQVVGEVEGGDRVGHLEGRRGRRGDVAADAEPRPRDVGEPAGLGGELEDGLERRRREHRRHVSASVSDPAWNSDSRRSVFTSSGGGSMIRSKP